MMVPAGGWAPVLVLPVIMQVVLAAVTTAMIRAGCRLGWPPFAAAAEKPGRSRRRPARHGRIRWWCVSATPGGTGQDQFERILHGLLRTGEQQPNVRAMTMAGAR